MDHKNLARGKPMTMTNKQMRLKIPGVLKGDFQRMGTWFNAAMNITL